VEQDSHLNQKNALHLLDEGQIPFLVLIKTINHVLLGLYEFFHRSRGACDWH